jgi:hypothetical protein
VQLRLGDGQHVHDAILNARADILSEHGAAISTDRHDHQRPEAQRDADQCRQVEQQPPGQKSSASFGRVGAAVFIKFLR